MQYNNASRQALGPAVHELQRHMDRVTCLSLLTLIYRSIPSEGLSSSAFCEDCIAAAKATLTEHEKCMSTMAENQLQSSFLGIYVNWYVNFPALDTYCGHQLKTSCAVLTLRL